MAKTKDPKKAAARWAQNMGAAGPAIQDGVMAVTTSPGQLAAAQADKWMANLQASKQRWMDRMNGLQNSAWQQAVIKKGIPRILSGAQEAQPTMEAFLTQWIQYEAQVVASLPPRGTLEQNIQRSAELQRRNAAAKGQFRGKK